MENVNQELLEKAKQAKSVEELLSLAEQSGVKLTEEQAKAFYAKLHPTSGEIEDDELDNVAGGGCGGKEDDGFHEGDRVKCPVACPKCGRHFGIITGLWSYSVVWGVSVKCENCDIGMYTGIVDDLMKISPANPIEYKPI